MTKHILIIDDEEAVRKSFNLALEDSGYKITTVSSGESGINEVKKNNVDLIFLDLKMPGMNGAKTLNEIRKINKEVPVYIITAFHKEFFSELEDARKHNLNFELLHKPIGIDDINVIVKAIFDGPAKY